jgi:nitrite reductase (cytochrome c-552)
MPYVREGAIKVSDHHVRSPLLDVARSCQTCHRFPEEQLKANVLAIQDQHKALMDRAESALVHFIGEVEKAKKAGASDAGLAQVFEFQRKAQWRVDFVNAENSMGFHAPQESARILGESIDYSRQGESALATLLQLSKTDPAPSPAPTSPSAPAKKSAATRSGSTPTTGL